MVFVIWFGLRTGTQFSEGRVAPAGARIVYVDGAFDLFHPGHVAFLKVRLFDQLFSAQQLFRSPCRLPLADGTRLACLVPSWSCGFPQGTTAPGAHLFTLSFLFSPADCIWPLASDWLT